MHRQRGGLVPIGDAVSGLDDVLVSALRNDSPQARRGFTGPSIPERASPIGTNPPR